MINRMILKVKVHITKFIRIIYKLVLKVNVHIIKIFDMKNAPIVSSSVMNMKT